MSRKRTILAVDDDEAFLVTLKDILEDAGYIAYVLSEPDKIEAYIDRYAPDVLIIDIFMPGRTGFNIVEDFRDKGVYDEIPKIFLTCLDDDVEKMTARACGVGQYVTKPFEPEVLIEKIKKAVK
ncbi:MAG: response regulator [Candidatus Omnitrophica bacterium]|nr:response regulator [Candidatus Omnitrophota bacterium]MDD5488967.1 response regulator [Candidatus Omnitrophota bacterium]